MKPSSDASTDPSQRLEGLKAIMYLYNCLQVRMDMSTRLFASVSLGVINLSSTIYLSNSFVILRGAGNGEGTDSTQLVFNPDDKTK